MTDVDETKKVDDTPKPDPVVLSLPPIKVGVWLAFTNGQLTYNQQCEKDGTIPAQLLSNFAGAVALYKAGMLHVSGPQEAVDVVVEVLEAKDITSFEGALIQQIADQVVIAIYAGMRKTPNSLKGSSLTLTIQSTNGTH